MLFVNDMMCVGQERSGGRIPSLYSPAGFVKLI